MTEEQFQATVVAAVIDLVAESGYPSVSTEAVARRAGTTARAVEEVFPEIGSLIAVTVGWLYTDLASFVSARIEAAEDGLPKITAYIGSMNRYFFDNPKHVRVLGEVVGTGEVSGNPGDRPRERRWQAVADLLSDGQRKGLLGEFDTRAIAIVIGGAIDGLIVEWTADPSFDLLGATDELVTLVEGLTRGAAFVP